MIRPGLVQDRILDLSSMNNPLPPLNTLPQWSRVNALDKARYPKSFVKDHKLNMDLSGGVKDGSQGDEVLAVTEMNPSQRIQYLERSLLFLRQQHSDVLHSLHEEVEVLKKENKELQFKIVMSQKAAQAMQEGRLKKKEKGEDGETETEDDGEVLSESSQLKLLEEGHRQEGAEKTEEMKVVFLEEEVKELKHALRETRNRNQYLTQLLEQAEEQRKRQQGALDAFKYEVSQGGMAAPESGDQMTTGSPPVQANGQPLTLQQCHAIIKHLQQTNERQSHELDRLKLDLRDVLYSHKWTPDAYLMAKAYVAEEDRRDEEKGGSLPRIPLKNPTRKLPEIAYIRENVSLPALRQTVGNKAVERRKRTQVLQRAKLRPGALPP